MKLTPYLIESLNVLLYASAFPNIASNVKITCDVLQIWWIEYQHNHNLYQIIGPCLGHIQSKFWEKFNFSCTILFEFLTLIDLELSYNGLKIQFTNLVRFSVRPSHHIFLIKLWS